MHRRALFLLLLLAVGVGACFAYRRIDARRPLEWSGTVEARTIDVGSRVGGRVQRVLVREGDSVQANQPLLVLEPGDLEAQHLQARGQVEQAEAALSRVSTKQGISSTRRLEIAGAAARLRAQEITVQKARLDQSRAAELVSKAAVPQTNLDNANAALRNAQAQGDDLRAQLNQLLRGTPEDVRAAEGQVDAANGKLQQIEVMLDELTIRAPRAARVETFDLRPGDMLAPNATAAKLLEPDQLFVRIYVPETQLGYVRPGMDLPLTVDTFPNRSFKGVVESVNSEGEFTPRNLQTADERANQVFRTHVRIEEGTDVLRAGMSTTVRVRR